MGLKSTKDTGFSFLGIRERKVEFKEGVILPESLEHSTAFSKSPPIKSKKSRKNSAGQPSSLGLLSFLKDFRAPSISPMETSSIKKTTSSCESLEGKRLITLSCAKILVWLSSLKIWKKCLIPRFFRLSSSST